MRLFLKSYNTDGKRNHMYKDFKVFNGKNIVIVIYVNTKSWIFFLNMKFCKINKWKLITVSDNVVLSTKFTLGAICDDAYLNIIWFTSQKHLLGQPIYIVMFAYMFSTFSTIVIQFVYMAVVNVSIKYTEYIYLIDNCLVLQNSFCQRLDPWSTNQTFEWRTEPTLVSQFYMYIL